MSRNVKKENKSNSNTDKECDSERAKANAALWEARLEVTENSRVEYREAARRLARANEELTQQQYRAEKDTTDIIAFVKQKELEKEAQVSLDLISRARTRLSARAVFYTGV